MTEVLNVTSGTSTYTMTKNCWVQVNLGVGGQNTNAIFKINDIVVIGFQHVSLQSYHSYYCRKNDVLKGSVTGTGFVQAYIQ